MAKHNHLSKGHNKESMDATTFTEITGIRVATQPGDLDGLVCVDSVPGHPDSWISLMWNGRFLRVHTGPVTANDAWTARFANDTCRVLFAEGTSPFEIRFQQLLDLMRCFTIPKNHVLYTIDGPFTSQETDDLIRHINPWRGRSHLILSWSQLLEEDRCPLPYHLMQEIVLFL